MRTDTYDDEGRLRRRLDDTARKVTVWDAEGSIIEERPYSTSEQAEADARAEAENGSHGAVLRRTLGTIRNTLDALDAIAAAPQPARRARMTARPVSLAAAHAQRARAALQAALAAISGA